MTQIRLRHLDASDPALLADVPFEDIDTVIPQLKMWGIRIDGDGYVDRDTISGEFVYEAENGAAYFEITFGGDVE